MRFAVALLCLGAFAQAPKQEWISLFDGKTLKGWSKAGADAWEVKDGTIHSLPKPLIREDLISDLKFKNFELTWEWKIAPKANSGLKYLIQDAVLIDAGQIPPTIKKFEDQVAYAFAHRDAKRELVKPGTEAQIYPIAFEYQLIDNNGHRDALEHKDSTAGALYRIFVPTNAVPKPVGEWNSSRVVLEGNHVQHWLNGVKVVDAQLNDPQVAKRLAERWPPGHPVYDLLTKLSKRECPISLQHHNDEAWFRNIQVRRLP